MKFEILSSHQRGHFLEDWLDSYHTFNFAKYSNGKFTQFGPLRVLNEDFVGVSNGFGRHPHRNYEIFTYVLSGQLTHSDSMGNVEVCTKGSVQFTSAGSGIEHSEFNRNKRDICHLLQIWVKPRTLNSKPNYQLRNYSKAQKLNQLCMMIAPKEVVNDPESENLIAIDQDFYVLSCILEEGKQVTHSLHPDRQIYIHIPLFNQKKEDTSGKSSQGRKKDDDIELPIVIKVTSNSSSRIIELSEGDGCFIHFDSKNLLQDEQLIIEGVHTSTEFVLMDMQKLL